MLLFLFIIVFSLCCDFQFIVVIVVELVFLTHSFPLPPWPFYPFQLIKRKLGSDFLGIHVKHPVWFTICYFNGGKTKYEIKSENNKNVKRKEGKIENCLRKQASVFPWVFLLQQWNDFAELKFYSFTEFTDFRIQTVCSFGLTPPCTSRMCLMPRTGCFSRNFWCLLLCWCLIPTQLTKGKATKIFNLEFSNEKWKMNGSKRWKKKKFMYTSSVL